MEGLQSFYNNLFSIEITALGIIAAATFVFLQILHSNFSYKDMLLLLQRKSVLFYTGLSIILILITGFGSLHLAVGVHDFIPKVNFVTRDIFESSYTALLILVTFILSACLGIFTIFESVRLLNPISLLRKHLSTATNEAVEKFLYHKYGVPTPFPRVTILMSLPIKGKGKKKAEAENEKKVKDAEEEYEKDKAKYESLKKYSEGAADVFEGFINLVAKAIAGGDIGAVKNGVSDYASRLKEVTKSASDTFPLNHLALHVADTLTFLLEASRRHDIQSLAPELIRTTREIAKEILKSSNPDATKEILKNWKDQADIAIQTSDRALFREIMQSYTELGDIAFEQQKKNPKDKNDVLDEVFRNIGWLAERLLTKKGLEARPIMYDNDYHDEFDSLYNALFHFEWKYNNDNPTAYPLIFFDAIHVLFDRLFEIYKSPLQEGQGATRGGGDVKNRLFDCAYAYYSFARDALKVENSEGVALAAMDLKQLYQTAAEKEDIARDILDLIVHLAILISTNPEKMMKGTFLNDPVNKYLEEIITRSPYGGTIKSAVMDSYMKFDEGPHDKKLAYIKSLGAKMNTNFGLNFDPLTGQPYSQ